jgi:signal transduction histidine kinase
VEYDGCNEGRRLKNFFKDPSNLRYSLNTIIPLVVFLTSLLSGVVAANMIRQSKAVSLWVFGASLFSSLCSLVVILAMTRPVLELVKRAEKLVRFEESRKEKGQMIEVYKTIETLVEFVKKKGEEEGKGSIMDVEKLDYIIPLGYMSLMVAHEVRNPLNTITGMSELLKQRIEDDSQRPYIDAMLEAAKKIDKFTSELLDFTDNELTKEAFDVNDLIEEVRDNLHLEFGNVTCEFQKTENLPYFGDKTKIYQVIYNVAKNAYEYEKNGGYVRIKTTIDDSIRVSVYNKNSKIEKVDIDSVFKPFFTRKKGGRGLGLFISMRNIQLHNGDIKVESGEEGTTFEIILPKEEGSRIQGFKGSSGL